MNYRLYLLDERSSIAAAENFVAANHHEADLIADTIFQASRDVFGGYELWTGTERIAMHHGGPSLDLEMVAARHQEIIVELGEKLQAGFAAVARSKRLSEISDRLRRA